MRLNKSGDTFLNWIMALAVLASLAFSAGCENGHGKQEAAPPPIPEVAVVTVSPQAVLLTTELPGRTSAYRIAEIRPQVSGLIQKRLFTEGAEVKAGVRPRCCGNSRMMSTSRSGCLPYWD